MGGKYCYVITGDTSTSGTFETDESKIAELRAKGCYVSDDPVCWAEKRMPVFGVLEDIPKPEPPVIIIPEPTAEQLKQEREQKLDNLYTSRKTELALEYTTANMSGDTLKAAEYGTDYNALKDDYSRYKDSIEQGNDPFVAWGLGSFDTITGGLA